MLGSVDNFINFREIESVHPGDGPSINVLLPPNLVVKVKIVLMLGIWSTNNTRKFILHRNLLF